MGTMLSTPAMASKDCNRGFVRSSPMQPMTQRSTPWLTCGVQPMACTKLRCNLAAGELRQDDGLPDGTKVVPIMAAISPLIIIEQEGSHRRKSILPHINFRGIF